jgi:Ni,Fe-hydrogenase I small subunit
MSLANTIKETDVASLLLFDIDLDYNEQLCASAGQLAVEAAVSAIGKTTILALEGAIPAAATGGDEDFCTIWTRTGGILAYGSDVLNVPGTLGPTGNGLLVGAAQVALVGGDIIGAGSELVDGTELPIGTIVADAGDRAVISAAPFSISFNTNVGSSYGTDRTNANFIVAAPGITNTLDKVEITGGTDTGQGNGQTLVQGSKLAGAAGTAGTLLTAGTIATSSFDRFWLSEVNTLGAPVNTNVAAAWTYAGSANNWSLNAPVLITNVLGRAVSGPMVINNGSTIAAGSSIKIGTRVGAAAQTQFINNSTIATLFDGYGNATGTVYTLANQLNITGTDEIVLQGSATLPPLVGGFIGGNAATDKTILHEATVFGSSAAAILCVGTCSSFGGIPAASGNLTGASGALYKGLAKPGKYNGVLQQYAAKIINIGGCPPHSDWIVGTIAYILATNLHLPPVEAYARPMEFYGQYQCNAGPCEWRFNQGYKIVEENSQYANPKGPLTATTGGCGLPNNTVVNSSKLYKYKWDNSQEAGEVGKRYLGCIGVVGCKGRKTKADCSLRRWNADATGKYGTGWCVTSGAGCHGCTEPTFPDKVGKFFNFA